MHRSVFNGPVHKKSVGVSICFLCTKFCLSVGETCGLPRANTVRPYRGYVNIL